MTTMQNCAGAEEPWMQSWWLAEPRGTLELTPVEMQKGFAGMEIIPHVSTTIWPSTHTHITKQFLYTLPNCPVGWEI